VGASWREIEEKWQRRWSEAKLFESDPDPSKPKFFVTVAYPYPNSPQHIGHARTYSLTDAYARYLRMKGYNVLFPMGFHYTGTPILAMAKRIAAGDPDMIKTLTDLYKVPEEDLKQLTEPIRIARYFHREIKQGMKEMGFSIDWRREFTTIDPMYKKFIHWQFRKLSEKGYLTRGSHPVGWCPSCGNPLGQHDTLGDVEPEIEEFTLIKFRIDGRVLPTGTLRPETVYGVTNIWVNPEADYVEAEVDGETWVVSRQAAEKLKLLEKAVGRVRPFDIRSILGRKAVNPATGREIPVLPAPFVDPESCTGVVMSVPAHAPYDYAALLDLKKNPSYAERYGVSREVIEELEPIPIIKLEGYSEVPARDAVEKLGVRSQRDEDKLEEATKEVYSAEFRRGVMLENTPYAGMPVSEAKQRVKEDLIAEGKADTMYEVINSPVYCRCGAKCVVKIFRDQWFIDYSNPEWKQLARECLGAMRIVPEKLRQEFKDAIEWVRQKACARKQGLGTPLPWDPSWIIESLSDSVIYMAYYIIAKYVNSKLIDPEKVKDSFFSYVFLGEGDPNKVAEENGVPKEVLEEVRREFQYYYPLDSRHSGRDLVWNHLTYFIFNHVAIFPRELWPRQIVVNGSVLREGKAMSKSLGNIIPLRQAIRQYGADTIRATVLSTAGLLADAEFNEKIAASVSKAIQGCYSMALKLVEFSEDREEDTLDKWIQSAMRERVEQATEAMEEVELRNAIQVAMYMVPRDISRYLKRRMGSSPARSTALKIARVWARLLAPIVPHMAEELWSKLGGEGFVSAAKWPTPDELAEDKEAEAGEMLVDTVLEDVESIVKATKIKPRIVHIYTAPEWKWEVYRLAAEQALEGKLDPRELTRQVMAKPEMRARGKEAADLAKKACEDLRAAPRELVEALLSMRSELSYLESAKSYLEAELDAEVKLYMADDPQRYDPADRAKRALPMKPAIYLEA